jgi:hypothetical protein
MKIASSLLTAIALVLAGNAVGQTSSRKDINENPVITFAAKLPPSFDVSIAVKTRAVKAKDLDDRIVTSQFPEFVRIINGLEIMVNKTSLFVPRSTYADLLDVRSAEMSLTEKSGNLLLRGGDASESFLARIEFDRRGIKRRALFNSESPGKPLQETIYHRRVMEDRQ